MSVKFVNFFRSYVYVQFCL